MRVFPAPARGQLGCPQRRRAAGQAALRAPSRPDHRLPTAFAYGLTRFACPNSEIKPKTTPPLPAAEGEGLGGAAKRGEGTALPRGCESAEQSEGEGVQPPADWGPSSARSARVMPPSGGVKIGCKHPPRMRKGRAANPHES